MGIEYIGYFLLSIVILWILFKLFSWPLKMLFWLIGNAIIGAILLFFTNIIGSSFNFNIGINIWTSLISGCFGIPGVVFLVIFKLFL